MGQLKLDGFAVKDGELSWSTGALEYQKFQITNHKYQINHNSQIRNPKPVLVIEYLPCGMPPVGGPAEGGIPQGEDLRFVWNLVLGIWDFISCFYSTTPLLQQPLA